MSNDSRNGKYGTILRLGDRTPHTEPIELERDGRPVALLGYVAGKRCPLSVQSHVDAVTNAYWDAVRVVDGEGKPVLDENGNEQFGRDGAMFAVRVRETLKAVIPTITAEEADVIANDFDIAVKILTHLGWFRPAEDEADADPEAAGETAPESPSIGEAESRTSSASTA